MGYANSPLIILTIRNKPSDDADLKAGEKHLQPPLTPGEQLLEDGRELLSKKDPEGAIKAFTQAIQNGAPKGHIELAQVYIGGQVKQNTDLAVEHLIQAVDAGVGAAHAVLGKFHYHGIGGLPVDLGSAVHHFREGIDMGDHDSKAHFGWMTLQGHGVPHKDLAKGMALLKEAEPHSLDAVCYMGILLLEGVGQPPNHEAAFEHFTRAANKGHLEAKFNLANMHLYGRGTKKSVWDAAKIFTQAAEGGHSTAQVNIGMMYRDGVGVKVSLPVAKSWFEKSAAQGDALGSYCLAKMLLDERAPDCDWLDVCDLFAKAAQQGNVRGEFNESLYIDSLARVFDGFN